MSCRSYRASVLQSPAEIRVCRPVPALLHAVPVRNIFPFQLMLEGPFKKHKAKLFPSRALSCRCACCVQADVPCPSLDNAPLLLQLFLSLLSESYDLPGWWCFGVKPLSNSASSLGNDLNFGGDFKIFLLKLLFSPCCLPRKSSFSCWQPDVVLTDNLTRCQWGQKIEKTPKLNNKNK